MPNALPWFFGKYGLDINQTSYSQVRVVRTGAVELCIWRERERVRERERERERMISNIHFTTNGSPVMII